MILCLAKPSVANSLFLVAGDFLKHFRSTSMLKTGSTDLSAQNMLVDSAWFRECLRVLLIAFLDRRAQKCQNAFPWSRTRAAFGGEVDFATSSRYSESTRFGTAKKLYTSRSNTQNVKEHFMLEATRNPPIHNNGYPPTPPTGLSAWFHASPRR